MSTIRDHLWWQYQRARKSVRERPVGSPSGRELLSLPPPSGARRVTRLPTILVHGYKDDATVFRPLARHLSEIGVRTHAVTLAPSDCSVPVETLAQQFDAYLASNFAANQRLDIVGFSLGGIVARYYIQRMGGLARTGRFLSVATPHHGTLVALVSRLPAALQLRPDSSFLRDLNSDAEQLSRIQFGSIWTPLDLMIVPSFSSVMPVGKNKAVWALKHQALITSRRGIDAIAEQLTAGDRGMANPAQPGMDRRPAMSR